MRFNTTWLAVVALVLAGCGGGRYNNPYDGTWSAVYPVANTSSVTATQTVYCDTPPAPLTLKDGAGTTTVYSTCTTTTLATTTAPEKKFDPVVTYYQISVAIDGNGVVNAMVSGVTFTGQCISNVGCPSASAAGDTLSVTR